MAKQRTSKRLTVYVLAKGQQSTVKNYKSGRYVSKAYAERYPHKVTPVRVYRSLATGWNIKESNVEDELTTQRLHEAVRHYNKERGVDSPKVEQHVVDLIERIKKSPAGMTTLMLQADPEYERLFEWMLDHEDQLELDLGPEVRGELEQIVGYERDEEPDEEGTDLYE